ncbi:hypothetical protein PhCBS80983_g02850 [Powellomyces hirtus]|uniref:Chromate transporter n=1 Tax=Powellomyces hirtus TaxID=109895 RepID=A0A507E480_9FUNG|nr:hypothetical protein PhCBS80983_g02850 [Powellomyces hirtus]
MGGDSELFSASYITFGGPPAHIAILHEMFVVEKKWLSEEMFAELLGISSALPGPASTQLAYTVALIRDGLIPAIWAFFIWSVPGGIIMTVFGLLIGGHSENKALPQPVLFLENGLASSAVALDALAAYNLSNKICIDTSIVTKIITAVAAALTVIFTTEPWLMPSLMAFGGLTTYGIHLFTVYIANDEQSRIVEADESAVEISVHEPLLPNETPSNPQSSSPTMEDPEIYFSLSMRTGIASVAIWAVLFLGATLLRSLASNRYLQIFGTFYYVGSVIFGGGTVVTPLLYSYVVKPGWASSSDFLLGLAIINTLPGPNFNFAAFCGAISLRSKGIFPAMIGALLAWIGMFTPGLLIKKGVLPLWKQYRGFPTMQIVFRGVNAAVVGLVLAATYLLSQRAISIANGGDTVGPLPVGKYPLYVALVGITFVTGGFLKVPAPYMIFAGGIVGILDWFVTAS